MSFDTDRFVIEVQCRPVLWDQEKSEYSNKHLKLKAWEEVAALLYDDYELKEAKEKNDIYGSLIRKWKSLRDSYVRELNFQLNKKSGSSRSNKKPYIYFNQLSFLRNCMEKRKTSSSLDESAIAANSTPSNDNDDEINIVDTNDEPVEQNETCNTPVPKVDVRPATVTSKKRNRDALMATEMKILQDMSKRLSQKPVNEQVREKETEQDPDKLFLLSLLPDIKKVHEDDRLEMKGEIMNVVGKWKRARQYPIASRHYQQYNNPMMSTHNANARAGNIQSTSAATGYYNNSDAQHHTSTADNQTNLRTSEYGHRNFINNNAVPLSPSALDPSPSPQGYLVSYSGDSSCEPYTETSNN